MTLADFFLAVNSAGVRLANVGGQLQLRGLGQAITPEIRAAAAEHKSAVLALLPPMPAASQSPSKDANTEASASQNERQAAEEFTFDQRGEDWRLEWLLELAVIYLRMRGCRDEAVLARLRPLAESTLKSLAEWLILGQKMYDVEDDLRRSGQLPGYPWPAEN